MTSTSGGLAEVASRSALDVMSAEAAGTGYTVSCELGAVPGLPSLRADMLRALLGGAEGEEVSEELRAKARAVRLASGDENEMSMRSLEALLDDDDNCDEILAVLQPDTHRIFNENGWPSRLILKCSCRVHCLANASRRAAGRERVDACLGRLDAARERHTTPREVHHRPDGGSLWLQASLPGIDSADLDAFLAEREMRDAASVEAAGASLKDEQLAIAAILTKELGCCRETVKGVQRCGATVQQSIGWRRAQVVVAAVARVRARWRARAMPTR